jgi:hypothetical protein
MEATFITTGEFEAIFKMVPGKDYETVDHYKVGRKGMGTIHISNFVAEYGMKGKQIRIDKYGSAWVKSS